MLTKDDLELARRWNESRRFHSDLSGRYSSLHLDALAAYGRVVALRQELVDFMASSHARPKLAIEDVLRKLDRALEG